MNNAARVDRLEPLPLARPTALATVAFGLLALLLIRVPRLPLRRLDSAAR
jgi:hypothetical protein